MSTLTISDVHSDYQGQQVLKGLDLTLKRGRLRHYWVLVVVVKPRF